MDASTPPPTTASAPPFEVGGWRVLPRRLTLQHAEGERAVTPKVMDVLVALARRPGEVVTKDELLAAAWPGVHVSDGAIRRTVSHLRDALGDDAATPAYIETVATVGYRLIAPVRPAPPEEAPAATEPPLPAASTPARPHLLARWGRPRLYAGVAACAFLAVGAAGVWLLGALRGAPSPAAGAPALHILPVTTLLGDEVAPSLSPGATHLAFTRVRSKPDGSRQADLFVKVMGTEGGVQLTDDAAFEASTIWSPDGAYLAFVRVEEGEGPTCGIYRVAAIGGPLRKLAACALSATGGPPALSWSADGTQVAFAHPAAGERAAGIYSVSVSGAIAQRLTAPPAGTSDHAPAFSPDGQYLAFVRAATDGASALMVQAPDPAATPRALYEHEGPVWGAHWSEDGRAVYVLADAPGPSAALWKVTVPGGIRQRLALPPGVQPAGDVAVQRGHLVFVTAPLQADLWRIAEAGGPAERLSLSSTRLDLLPQLSPSGDRVAFFSDRSGRVGLWAGTPDGRELTELAPAQGTDFTPPAWSADGTRVAYGSSEGLFEVTVATGRVRHAAVGRPRTLAVAPDGVLFLTLTAADGPHVHRADSALTTQRVSPPGVAEVLRHVDAEHVYVTRPDRPGVLLRRSRAGGGEAVVATAAARDETVGAWAWGDGGFSYATPAPEAAIYHFDLVAQQARLVHRLADGQARTVSRAPDGTLVYDLERVAGFDVRVVPGFEAALP